ncbi:serine/threonine protein kinase [Pseudenhygromyxa sp. WMMC2535]|uniref:protein kinase domain-containing protein n=1 Tax=Pseudenhygromyxa sp. WMMC2535 TaxID=2712867 RepID=UPI001552478C|nr:protein kinase [Pseudenhygromyxa sp. WMMC2535]NVB42323.1 serine/threonine protein kinase [Pseudenhygromyxa sp. WMMC2535]
MSARGSQPKAKDLLDPGTLVGCRYRVEALVKEQPLGELYRCLDTVDGSPVLLERLRREFSEPEVHTRLFETRGSAALDDPAIVDLVDYGDDIDGRMYLVTVPARGAVALDELHRPMDSARALELLEALALALSRAHEQGLVHGAIEPANVLLGGGSTPGRISLQGFGLLPALHAGTKKSRALPLLGAPSYAPPELVRGEALGPSADVYGLGVLLWELLTGAPPFVGPTLRVLDDQLNRELPEPDPELIAPELAALLRRMLAKDPRARFADAAAVLEEIRALRLAGVDTPARSSQVMAVSAFDLALEPDPSLDTSELWTRGGSGEVLAMDEPEGEVRGFVPGRARRRAVIVATAAAVLLAVGGWLAHDTDAVVAALGGDSSAALLAEGREVAERAEDERVAALAKAAVGADLGARGDADLDAGDDADEDLEGEASDDLEDTIAGRLRRGNFNAHKGELYRRVGRVCLDGDMRRTVKVSIRVDEQGEVVGASAGSLDSSKLGRCVRRQARKLRFPASEKGGRHEYTLRLR